MDTYQLLILGLHLLTISYSMYVVGDTITYLIKVADTYVVLATIGIIFYTLGILVMILTDIVLLYKSLLFIGFISTTLLIEVGYSKNMYRYLNNIMVRVISYITMPIFLYTSS